MVDGDPWVGGEEEGPRGQHVVPAPPHQVLLGTQVQVRVQVQVEVQLIVWVSLQVQVQVQHLVVSEVGDLALQPGPLPPGQAHRPRLRHHHRGHRVGGRGTDPWGEHCKIQEFPSLFWFARSNDTMHLIHRPTFLGTIPQELLFKVK